MAKLKFESAMSNKPSIYLNINKGDTRISGTNPSTSGDSQTLLFMPSLDCYIGEESGTLQYPSNRLAIVKDMRQAGALQFLLVGLARCQREGWSENSIAKILSILVAHEEEDSAML